MIRLSGTDALRIARMCHEANRAFCEYNGDTSQHAWEDAPQWQKDSAVTGVRFVALNPNVGDDACHNNWMRDKIADGWTFGEVKDAEAKTHPCLVPFEELPADQQFKDKLFISIVRAAMAGLAG